jgi:hypothetical protein
MLALISWYSDRDIFYKDVELFKRQSVVDEVGAFTLVFIVNGEVDVEE